MPCSRHPAHRWESLVCKLGLPTRSFASLPFSLLARQMETMPHSCGVFRGCVNDMLPVAAALLAPQGLAPAITVILPPPAPPASVLPTEGGATQGHSNRGKPRWNYKLIITTNSRDRILANQQCGRGTGGGGMNQWGGNQIMKSPIPKINKTKPQSRWEPGYQYLQEK